jgi:lauroyl/myristoyl acyltransferase
MVEVNAAYERAIRRDPANWFWPHRRWKSYYKRLENQQKENAENKEQQ